MGKETLDAEEETFAGRDCTGPQELGTGVSKISSCYAPFERVPWNSAIARSLCVPRRRRRPSTTSRNSLRALPPCRCPGLSMAKRIATAPSRSEGRKRTSSRYASLTTDAYLRADPSTTLLTDEARYILTAQDVQPPTAEPYAGGQSRGIQAHSPVRDW